MSTINDFGIEGISTGILMPKQQHRWRVVFVGIAGGSSSLALSHQLVTITRPKLNFDKVQLDRSNSRAYIAGKHTIEPVSITLEDDMLGTASLVIQKQLQIQQWITGSEGPFLGTAAEGSQYKFAARLEMLDGSQTDKEIIERITMEGCWIENVDYGELDYAQHEAVKINLTLSIDHFRQDLGGYGGPNQALGGEA